MRRLIKSLIVPKLTVDSTLSVSLSKDEIYKDVPLEGSRDIRLLRVDGFSKTVVCELIPVSLDSLPGPYTAVSYRWDDVTTSSGQHRVPCGNGKFLVLGKTLYSILEYFSKGGSGGGGPSLVWIDALCINQNDMEEKSHQVGMMRDIYSYANQVLVWFGAPTVISDVAIDTVWKLECFFRRVDAQEPAAMETMARYRVMNFVRAPVSWQNLGKFLQREWFQRIWIIQEVVAGAQVVMVCGKQKIPWETFSYVMTKISHHGLHDLLKQDNTTPWGLLNTVLIQELREIRLQGKYLPLHFMLSSTLEFKASDWRDKVFALLGIATGSDHEAVNPDYTKLPQEVYTLTAGHLLTQSPDLFILSAAGIGRPRSFPDLPSWVPDWSREYRGSCLAYGAFRSGFAATGDSTPLLLPTTPTPTILSLQGMIIDMVDQLAPTHPIPLQGPDQHNTTLITQCTKEELHALQQSQRLASTLSPYPTGEQYQDAHWRTIIANMNLAGDPAPATLGPGFHSWLSLLQHRAQWNVAGSPPRTQPSTQDITQADSFRVAFSKHGLVRRFFTTHGGYMGIGPQGIITSGERNDVVALLQGAVTPFILRPVGEGEAGGGGGGEGEGGGGGSIPTYSLVGECYVHGLMKGEGMALGEIQQIRLC